MDVPLPLAASRRLISFLTFQISICVANAGQHPILHKHCGLWHCDFEIPTIAGHRPKTTGGVRGGEEHSRFSPPHLLGRRSSWTRVPTRASKTLRENLRPIVRFGTAK